MSKEPQFDPDKPFVKVRGMGSIHFEQNGHRFGAGHQYIGPIDEKPKPQKKAAAKKKRGSARERAQAKIANKKGEDPLKGFRGDETPDAVSSAVKEDDAARQAEEHAE